MIFCEMSPSEMSSAVEGRALCEGSHWLTLWSRSADGSCGAEGSDDLRMSPRSSLKSARSSGASSLSAPEALNVEAALNCCPDVRDRVAMACKLLNRGMADEEAEGAAESVLGTADGDCPKIDEIPGVGFEALPNAEIGDTDLPELMAGNPDVVGNGLDILGSADADLSSV